MGLKQKIINHARAKEANTPKSIGTSSTTSSFFNADHSMPSRTPEPDSYEAFILQAEQDEAVRVQMEKRARKEARRDPWNGGMGARRDPWNGGMVASRGVGGMNPTAGGAHAWLSGNGLKRQ
jgi:hypothetical protein